MFDAAQHGGAGVSAAQPEVGFYLDVLGEGTLHLDIRRCRDLDIVSKAAEQAGTRRPACAQARRLRQQRAEIRLWIKPVRSTVMVPERMLLAVVPLKRRSALATVLTPSG